jgi:uncharacterized protein (TIGR01244 family)
MRDRLAAALVIVLGAAVPAAAWHDWSGASPTMRRVTDRVWVGGQPSNDDLALLCGAGVRMVVDLRQPVEHDVDAERFAVEGLGMAFAHIPVNGEAPEDFAADAFLAALSRPNAFPVFVHCASGNRAAGFWMIRRLVVDRWTPEAAEGEARRAGLRSEVLRDFAVDYAARRLGTDPDAPRGTP